MQCGTEKYFEVPVEADISETVLAMHDKGITEDVQARVNFFTGDACEIKSMHQAGKLQTYDGVIMSNLLCRLPRPASCLNGLSTVVKPGGVVVMVTLFSWLEEFTARSQWLGGFADPVTKDPINSYDTMACIMNDNGFVQIHTEEMPLIIREHQRKYQYIVSQATGWRRKQD